MSETPKPDAAAVVAQTIAPATQSPTIGKLAEALSVAQGMFEAATKDRANPFFGSRYATLSSVWDACREGLATNSLSVVQQVGRTSAGEVSVRTMLMHASGEWISSTITLPVLPMQKKDGTEMKVTAQSYGSAITYGRRYGLAAAVGIAPDDDDDGNAASHAEPTSPIRPPSRPAGARTTGILVPFGDDKGKDVADLSPEAMAKLAKYVASQIDKPEKKDYRESNQRLLNAIDGERAAREAK